MGVGCVFDDEIEIASGAKKKMSLNAAHPNARSDNRAPRELVKLHQAPMPMGITYFLEDTLIGSADMTREE